MDRIVALCKRRGFVFQSSEIYGGINGFWDYGPLGVELKRNIKDAWWKDMVQDREDMVGLDCSIIMHPQVWKVSGHYDLFSDMMVDCMDCKRRFRADKVFVVTLAGPAGPAAVLGVEADGVAGAAEALPQAIAAWAKQTNAAEFKKAEVTVAGTDARVKTGKAEYSTTIQPLQKLTPETPRRCPECAQTLTDAREFNLMFMTYVGALIDEDSKAFLRPETAQGIFVNFKNVCDTTRIRVPFGIGQIGKSFRNEITPRNFTFRSREFEQMEIEFFCHPSESNKWYEYWRDTRFNWYTSLGLTSDKLRLREHDKDELSHYSCGTSDIEYAFPFLAEGDFGELEGVAHRGDFDLRSHMEGKLVNKDGQLVVDLGPDGKPKWKGSGKDLSYFDDERKERFVPHVIEPSAGADRGTLAFICEAYTVDESRPSPELMQFHPRLAPIKAAIFPLVNKDGLPEIAEPIYREVRKRWPSQYDAKASIGKRYARMDEAGTPYCFTIDGQTKEDGTVTVRDRDTGAQERIDKSRVVEYLTEKLAR
ncbi:MAG: glycine--tRNA ligase [Planctomycetes bacterium]|nr:glycine--tRNA ligase [Planctomycetota bacterium]